MDIANEVNLNNNLLLEKNLDKNIEKEQNKFLESTIGKIINKAVDIGISAIVPDLIEDEVIDVKDAILENGFKEGIKTAVDKAINLGKSFKGIVTGKFEDISQAQTVIKSGGILDSVSGLLDIAVNAAVSNDLLNKSIGNLIKNGKDLIINQIDKDITEEFGRQANGIEKLGKYINQWKKYYIKQDFEGMSREYDKIREKMKELMPLEKTILEARKVENLHQLIKNNNKNFDITEEKERLAEILV